MNTGNCIKHLSAKINQDNCVYKVYFKNNFIICVNDKTINVIPITLYQYEFSKINSIVDNYYFPWHIKNSIIEYFTLNNT